MAVNLMYTNECYDIRYDFEYIKNKISKFFERNESEDKVQLVVHGKVTFKSKIEHSPPLGMYFPYRTVISKVDKVDMEFFAKLINSIWEVGKERCVSKYLENDYIISPNAKIVFISGAEAVAITD